MRLLLLMLAVAFGPLAYAEDLRIISGSRFRLIGGGEVNHVGGLTLSTSNTGRWSPVGIVTIKSDAANVELTISDERRRPLQPEPVEIADRTYLIETAGRWWVEVTAIDFDKNIYGRKTVLVEVGNGPNPPPDPDPEPDPDPDPPAPEDVPNEYGVGLPAYQNAPQDRDSLQAYASIFQRAGDFLFGVPSLKFITSSDSADARNPDRSVLAWIVQQQDRVPCPDEAKCAQWKVWRDKVNAALVESQRRRQFTRQDWYNAFGEISRALRMVR